MKEDSDFDVSSHDVRDPNPWLAMYLDSSIPMEDATKRALMRDNSSNSARYLLPMIRVSSKLSMFFIHIFKFFFPTLINSSKFLHKILAWGLRVFVSPDANLLIFRHFHVGSEIMEFISKNVEGVEVTTNPLKPYNFEDIKEDLFLKHDLNLYNFVIKLNHQLREKNLCIKGKKKIDLSMITPHRFNHIDFPKKWTNILDLRSAIELFTPCYQLFLTSNDFIRASNSLQLDETIGIYTAQILNTPAHLGLVNNKHPMIPATTYTAAFRLVLHGLAAETLHCVLVNLKLDRSNDGIITPGKEETQFL